jgi:hypothetical protein
MGSQSEGGKLMERKTLALGYRKVATQSPEVWVALDLLSYECTPKGRPQVISECTTVDDFNEQIDMVIAELQAIRLEGQKRLAENSN